MAVANVCYQNPPGSNEKTWKNATIATTKALNYYSLYRVALNVSMDNAAMLCWVSEHMFIYQKCGLFFSNKTPILHPQTCCIQFSIIIRQCYVHMKIHLFLEFVIRSQTLCFALNSFPTLFIPLPQFSWRLGLCHSIIMQNKILSMCSPKNLQCANHGMVFSSFSLNTVGFRFKKRLIKKRRGGQRLDSARMLSLSH